MDVASLLRPVYEGRRVALVSGPLQSKTGYIQPLRDLGAADCMVVGTRGTGPEPDAELVVVDVDAGNALEEIRRWERLAAAPPAEVVAALDRFAPHVVLTNGFESFTSFGGRPVFGARHPSWTALEDKTTVDALWDDAGVARAACEVVPVGEAWAAHERLDAGDGTVWSGDAAGGWHGGGELVRWVRARADASAALGHLRPRCDRVRVAPFLDGLPCSIHGFVAAGGVAAMRPVEMVVLREARGFRYAACATTWDPAPSDREEMREAVRRTGALLRERVEYRGWFTIDGVMTRDGFRPTELNPRMGAGIRYVTVAAPEVLAGLLHFAVVAGAVEVDAVALERAVLDAADRVRIRGCHVLLDRPQREEVTHVDGDVTLVLGPGPAGGFLRVQTETTPPDGEPYAPVAVRALALADERWSLGLGRLEPAPLVR